MVDIEDDVIALLEPQLQAVLGEDFFVYSDENLTAAEKQCGYLREVGNVSDDRTADSGGNENHAIVTLAWSAYVERQSEKKAACKQIFDLGDAALLRMGLRRVSKAPVEMHSPTKYRIDGRYQATVSKNKEIIGGYDLGNLNL